MGGPSLPRRHSRLLGLPRGLAVKIQRLQCCPQRNSAGERWCNKLFSVTTRAAPADGYIRRPDELAFTQNNGGRIRYKGVAVMSLAAKVLLVDDDTSLRSALAIRLRGAFDVLQVENASEALEALEADRSISALCTEHRHARRARRPPAGRNCFPPMAAGGHKRSLRRSCRDARIASGRRIFREDEGYFGAGTQPAQPRYLFASASGRLGISSKPNRQACSIFSSALVTPSSCRACSIDARSENTFVSLFG